MTAELAIVGHLWLTLLGCCLLWLGCAAATGGRPFAGAAFFTWHNVDEEVEHVALDERGGDVGPLQCASLVIFSVDPCAHCELGDEDVAAFGKEDRSFSADHLDLGIGLHHLFDSSQRQLVHFEVVSIGFEVVDRLLPVGGEDLT